LGGRTVNRFDWRDGCIRIDSCATESIGNRGAVDGRRRLIGVPHIVVGQELDMTQYRHSLSSVLAEAPPSEPVRIRAGLRQRLAYISTLAYGIPPAAWMLFDMAAAAMVVALAYRYSPKAIYVQVQTSYLIFFPCAALLGGLIAGLYERQVCYRLTRLLFATILTSIIAGALLNLYVNLIEYEKIGRWIILLATSLLFAAETLPRLVTYYAHKVHKIRVLLVGDQADSLSLAARLENDRLFDFIGFCSEQRTRYAKDLGEIGQLPDICRRHKIDQIVIASHCTRRADVLDRCFEAAQAGCGLLDEWSFYEEAFEQVAVDHIDASWFFHSKLGVSFRFQAFVKRLMDIVIALFALVLTSWLFPILWFLVRLTSWGPAFYLQTRCGQFGRPFKIYKFRSMTVDAEANGAVWAARNDPRVTPVGYLLRKTRLDELPQLWNVLKGDMSFVGPRPERPELVKEIEKEVPFFSFRHWVRPGLTGLAQIRYQYGATIDDAREKLKYDLYYVKNWSILLDIQIILRTLVTVMKGSR